MNAKLPAFFLAAATALSLPATAATKSMPADDSKRTAESHQAAAYIEQQLDDEITLPNGSKVEPVGVIVGVDGATRPMLSGQMYTLDGRLINAPFLDVPLRPEASSPARVTR